MLNQLRIPIQKFYPPRFSPDQCLYRGDLIEKALGRRGANKQIIVIEAQAGQGKTTLIQQYLKRYDFPFFWYQFGEEDRDPVFFVAALLAGLSRNIPGLTLPQMEHLLSAGQAAMTDLTFCVEGVRQQLASAIRGEYCLVFDDLHLLDRQGEQTLSLLQQFVASPAAHLRFFLAARRPSGLDFKEAFTPGQYLHLRNEQMSLTLAESRELFQSVFHLDIPGTLLEEIHSRSGGWVMGLVSFAHSLEQAGSGADLNSLLLLPRTKEPYLDYFRREVFAQLPDQMKESLLALSLLDEIPVRLAVIVTGRAEIAEDLAWLQQRNFFVRTLDEQGSTFGMHHLFGEFLGERAKVSFAHERIKDIYQVAANFYLGSEAMGLALDYFIRGESWPEVEELLAAKGMTFITRNQTRTLALLLAKIPADIRTDRAWLLFFSAIAANELEVIFSLAELEQAKRIFAERGQRKGELLVLSQIIWLHMASTGRFAQGRKLLGPADQLYDAIKQELSIDETVMVCRNIGAGALLFDLDVKTSAKYHEHGALLAREHQLSGYHNIIMIFQAYALHFTGKMKECVARFEEIYPYFYSKQIGVSGKLSVLTLMMNLLETLDEAEVYELRKKRVPAHLSQQQMFNFILGPYLILWDLYLDVASGDFARSTQVYDHKRREIESLNPQYLSQILGVLAYIFSLRGEQDQALMLLERACALRRQVAGIYYITLQRICAGATYVQCGLYDLAGNELEQAIAALRDRGNTFLLASALMHRAWLSWQLHSQARGEVLPDLAEALDLSLLNGILYFRFVPPGVVEPLLLLAVRYDIQASQARTLLRALCNKGVTAQGQPIPLLELNFLGGIVIRYEDTVVCRSEDLSHLQRELLALLVAAPGQQISQEQVQTLFWPESTPEKARANLDTLLSRLRSLFSGIIPKNSSKKYLTLHKGILALQHCVIDTLAFRREVRNGLQHLTARQAWQAENCFLKAMAVWQGPFAPEILGGADQVLFCRSELLDCFARMALGWGESMVAMGRSDEAIDLLRQAIGFLPTDDRLIRRLYRLLHARSFQQAMKLLMEYRQALIREEYSPREVEEIIAQVSR